MGRLRVLTGRQICQILEQHGFSEARPNRFADPAHPVEPDSWAEAVRKGLIQPAESTAGIPPRIPAVPFDDLMRDLKRDREDR
jgi:hypothetical protein